MADYRDTLLLPFEKGMLDMPQTTDRGALLNASVLSGDDDNWHQRLVCEQGFRGDYLALQQRDFNVEPSLTNLQGLAVTLVLASRSRALNEKNLTRAWNATRAGGAVVFCGQKTAGVQPLRKWAAKHAPIAGSLSKHHAIVFWLIRDGEDWPLTPAHPLQDGFHVSPGMFSASGPDKGSVLLSEQFGNHMRGKVADFGAGWGYLSAQLRNKSDTVQSLDLFEADWRSLEAAKLNVGSEANYHWADLTGEAPRGPFDWIIMNPPFHIGRASDPGLGTKFIEAAARALPSGGHLLMVANTNLPYEKTLDQHFKRVERKAQENGFKVIEAVR